MGVGTSVGVGVAISVWDADGAPLVDSVWLGDSVSDGDAVSDSETETDGDSDPELLRVGSTVGDFESVTLGLTLSVVLELSEWELEVSGVRLVDTV